MGELAAFAVRAAAAGSAACELAEQPESGRERPTQIQGSNSRSGARQRILAPCEIHYASLGHGTARLVADAEVPGAAQVRNVSEPAGSAHDAVGFVVREGSAESYVDLEQAVQRAEAKAGRSSAGTAAVAAAFPAGVESALRGAAAGPAAARLAAAGLGCFGRIGAMTEATVHCRGAGPRFPPSFGLAILREAVGISW